MQRLRSWIADRPKGELLVFGGLMAVALALRVYDLGARPFHHDESQDAYFSWIFAERGEYRYQPILHGPLRFYLTAANYKLFGDTDLTARLAPALMGTLIVGLPYFLRRQLGSVAAIATAVMLTVGPTYLYFSRFAREDIYVACITLGLIAVALRFLDTPRPAGPIALGVLLALSFATKESTFITVFVGGSFFIVATAVQVWRARRAGAGWRDAEIVRKVSSVGVVPWAYGVAAFWIVFALLFTVFFTNAGGLWDGIHDGIDYWLAQQDVRRGGERWYFYLAIMLGEEWPVLGLGLVGIAWSLRHPTTGRLFLVWAFGLSLAVYSWASERFAWLVMHPLLPLIVLAGLGLQAIWTARSRIARTAGLIAVGAGLAYAAYASYLVNAEHPVDPAEWLVSTQSSTDVKREALRVLALDDRAFARTRQHVTVNIDSGQGATFPWAWYFRHLPVGYIDMTLEGYKPDTQVLVMTEQARTKLLPELAAYQVRKLRFRVWWVRDWSKKFDAGAWWAWFAHRRTWNPTGGMPEYIAVRSDVR